MGWTQNWDGSILPRERMLVWLVHKEAEDWHSDTLQTKKRWLADSRLGKACSFAFTASLRCAIPFKPILTWCTRSVPFPVRLLHRKIMIKLKVSSPAAPWRKWYLRHVYTYICDLTTYNVRVKQSQGQNVQYDPSWGHAGELASYVRSNT